MLLINAYAKNTRCLIIGVINKMAIYFINFRVNNQDKFPKP